jgi:hypothetical protein
VTAAANCGEQSALAAVLDGGHHIGYVHAPSDKRGTLVNHPVIDFAGGIIAGVAGLDHLPAHSGPQLLDAYGRHSNPPLNIRLPEFRLYFP